MFVKILKLVGNFIQSLLDVTVTILGVIIFLTAVVMYFRGYHQDCQCVMLILIFLFLKNWKDEKSKKIQNPKNE